MHRLDTKSIENALTEQSQEKNKNLALANSIDPDQLASEE